MGKKGKNTITRNTAMNNQGTKDNCDYHNKKANRLVTTHNIEIINEHASYDKHRCYVYKKKCICECLDFNDFFQEGTVQGAKYGMGHQHRGGSDSMGKAYNNKAKDYKKHVNTNDGMKGVGIDTVASLKAAGEYWAAPSYIVSKDEVVAVKQIISALKVNHNDNSQIISWLHANNCGKYHSVHKHLASKKGRFAHDWSDSKQKFVKGDDADSLRSYKVKGINKVYGNTN